MSTLVGRAAVKRAANVALADTRWDEIIDLMRDLVSRQVEEITGRVFDKVERTELYPSYTQYFGDPQPQYVIVNCPPIDSGETVTLLWAPFDDHDTNGTALTTPDDWKYETDKYGEIWALRVQRFTSLPQNLPIPPGAYGTLGDSPTGFQTTYTGGYTVSDLGSPTDPVEIGEDQVVAVPVGLASLVTQKIADDFNYFKAQRLQGTTDPAAVVTQMQQAGGFGTVVSTGFIRPWSEMQLANVKMFARKDMAWIGPQFTVAAGRPLEGGRR